MPTPNPSSETTTVDLAEQARLAMDPARAYELLADVTPDYSIQQILELDDLRFNNFMRGLRIRLGVLGKEFSMRPVAVFALPYLKQMLTLLDYYYSSPELQAKAATIETDPHGNEYTMLAEMWRDIASYCTKVAALTGDEQFLVDAQAAYVRAIEVSKPEKNAHPLAQFEALILAFNSHMPVSLSSVAERWQEVIASTQDHDRIAKVSWEFMMVARKMGDRDAETKARQTCQEHANHLPGGYLRYAARQIIRSKVIAPVQRATYVGASNELKLSKPLAQELNPTATQDDP